MLGLQLIFTLAALAFVPGSWLKLSALLLCWALTFRALTLSEVIAYVAVSAIFALMDVMALRQGVFRFSAPDYLGLPVWEYFMWGFYVLHAIRMLRGPIPRGSFRPVVALGIVFALPFVTIANATMLLAASGAALALALWIFRERDDWLYVGYMIALGAAVEYTGVGSGQWGYPGNPPGGVPLWFVTMWAGVGLFARRLIVPLLYGEASTVSGQT